MSYLVSKLFWLACSPSTILLVFTAVALLILARDRASRRGFGLLIVGVAGFAACAILPLGTWLMRPLEDRFPQTKAFEEPVDGIILLGGAIDVSTSVDRGMLATNLRGERIVAFIALAQHHPHAQLLFTGGSAGLLPPRKTEADIVRSLTSQFGPSSRQMMFEHSSRNTHENALFSRRLAHPNPGQHWLLVTSAADMPRAVGCFRAVGWPVVPVPVDYHTQLNSAGWFPGLVTGLSEVDWATHEWVGLLYYRVRGWTPSLFPGPKE
jgi:uncharacterized SAM-binding protein YcdF (DUF218 family)